MGSMLCTRALLAPRHAPKLARGMLRVRRLHVSASALADSSAKQLAKAPQASLGFNAAPRASPAGAALGQADHAHTKLSTLIPSSTFETLPIDQRLVEQVTNAIKARNSLRLDGACDEPIRLSPVQRASFKHFFARRDSLVHSPDLSWAHLFRGQEGFLFPQAPGTSTLLGGETGGGKTLAYLLPLVQRLIETRVQEQPQFCSTSSVQQDEEASTPRENGTLAASADTATATDIAASEALWEEIDDTKEPEQEWTQEELLEAALAEEEAEPLHGVADHELDDVEAFLRSKTKGLFESGVETEIRQTRALALKHELEAWHPEAKEDATCLIQPRSVILAPTHELARQIATNIKSLTRTVEMRTLCTSQPKWIETLQKDVRLMKRGRWEELRPIDVLVTTPGRLIDITTPSTQRLEKFKSLHERYVRSGDVVKAEQIERHLDKVRAQQLISLDAVQVMVCDEADTLWDVYHYESTRHLVRAVYDNRINAWRQAEEGEGLPLVPADLIHVTASVTPAFKRQLANRFPVTINVLSKFLHQLPPTVRVKYAPILPSFNEAFVTQVTDALIADPTDRSKVLVICERRETVDWAQKVLKREGVLSCTLQKDSREHSVATDKNVAPFLIDMRRLNHNLHRANEGAPIASTSEHALPPKSAEDLSSMPAAYQTPEASKASAVEQDAASGTETLSEPHGQASEAALKPYAQRELELAILNGMDPLELDRLNNRLTNLDDKKESPPILRSRNAAHPEKKDANTPRVLITTSHLTRGIDFSPLVTHVIVPDCKPKAKTKVVPSMSERHVTDTMELLHRAGRVGRGGTRATLVLLDKVDLKTGRPNVKAEDRNTRATTVKFRSAVKSLRSTKLSKRELKELHPKKEWEGFKWAQKPDAKSNLSRKFGARHFNKRSFESEAQSKTRSWR